MHPEKRSPLLLLQKMKQKAMEQKNYGGEVNEVPASVSTRTCPNCGAGRMQQGGLTHCAYCGFEFIPVKLTDGINLKKKDNSGQL